jgi:hypothetical protein
MKCYRNRGRPNTKSTSFLTIDKLARLSEEAPARPAQLPFNPQVTQLLLLQLLVQQLGANSETQDPSSLPSEVVQELELGKQVTVRRNGEGFTAWLKGFPKIPATGASPTEAYKHAVGKVMQVIADKHEAGNESGEPVMHPDHVVPLLNTLDGRQDPYFMPTRPAALKKWRLSRRRRW